MLTSSGLSLTVRQREILAFIQSKPYPPTVREIGAAFGIRSPNGVTCHLLALERKGAIIRERGKARGILHPGDSTPLPPWTTLPFGGMIG